ncbi:MAG: hypothetical protein IPN95_02065 [Bacteroidetes bacterium]|nr:hypothetical protein [Bacteroidota bacterium]
MKDVPQFGIIIPEFRFLEAFLQIGNGDAPLNDVKGTSSAQTIALASHSMA